VTPLTDPRPFAQVLRDWIDRNSETGSAYSVANGKPLTAKQNTIRAWLAGAPCTYEREVRALMTLHDMGHLDAH